MLFIQNRYPNDFFCIFLSLFFLIGAPHCGTGSTATLVLRHITTVLSTMRRHETRRYGRMTQESTLEQIPAKRLATTDIIIHTLPPYINTATQPRPQKT